MTGTALSQLCSAGRVAEIGEAPEIHPVPPVQATRLSPVLSPFSPDSASFCHLILGPQSHMQVADPAGDGPVMGWELRVHVLEAPIWPQHGSQAWKPKEMWPEGTDQSLSLFLCHVSPSLTLGVTTLHLSPE